MKKNAIVNIKGGLGNQIFQIAFALDLESRNIRTICDTHFYDSNMQFPRSLELDPKAFGMSIIKFKNNKLFSIMNSIFQELDTFDFDDLKYLNRFVGYYQDFMILEKHKKLIKNVLGLNNPQHSNELVAIHIRQNDYKEINQDLSDSYYKKSIDDLLKLNKNLLFDVFTDDKNFVPNSNIFKRLNHVYYPDKNIKPIEVFRDMCRYKNYIIANSSFSALAAYLSGSDDKTVFYPNPWWRSSEIQIRNVPASWIPVINKK